MTSAQSPLILVSIDGFRWDYLDRGITPNLSALAAAGVRAKRMTPSFPSVTFPNHYTLVTGRYPDHHGIVNNTFEDAHIPPGVFHMASKDEAWWDQATPIWVAAERQGVATATEFWPGSEVAIHGVRPSRWEAYSAMKSGDQRVDTLLGWLSDPPATRPRFATLYFDLVDTAGHLHGPDSPDVNRAIAATDASIGRLVAGLKAQGLKPNLIIVADHGMAAIGAGAHRGARRHRPHERGACRLHRCGERDRHSPDARGRGRASQASGAARPSDLLGTRTDVPSRFHYGANARVPDVVCAAEVGWLVETRESMRKRHLPLLGEHGYDNAAPDMGALFIAEGPAFRRGLTIQPFENVDVYPLMSSLLGIHGRAERRAALRPAKPILTKRTPAR